MWSRRHTSRANLTCRGMVTNPRRQHTIDAARSSGIPNLGASRCERIFTAAGLFKKNFKSYAPRSHTPNEPHAVSCSLDAARPIHARHHSYEPRDQSLRPITRVYSQRNAVDIPDLLKIAYVVPCTRHGRVSPDDGSPPRLAAHTASAVRVRVRTDDERVPGLDPADTERRLSAGRLRARVVAPGQLDGAVDRLRHRRGRDRLQLLRLR